MNKKEVEEAMKETQEMIQEEISEEVVERPYTLRKLKDRDLFPLLQLFRKIGLKNFKESLIQATEGESVKEIGAAVVLDMADVIIANLEGASDEIYGFWSDLSGIPKEQILDMEFGTLPMMIFDTFSEVKNTAFFKVLSKFL